MIKKLNAVLFIAVVAMLLAKVALDKLGSSGAAPCAERVAVQVRNADFAPNVYFAPFVPYAMQNPMTGRNGYILDAVRAMFPKCKFISQQLDAEKVRKIIAGDPSAIVVYGDRLELRELPHAPTPVIDSEIVIYTRRSFEWTYDGIDSLKKLRVGLVEGYTACSNLVKACEVLKAADMPARIFSSGERYGGDPLKAVLDGVVDAVPLSKIHYTSSTIGITAALLVQFNVSRAIDSMPVYLYVANADAERAKQVIDACEKGMKEIEASGELRRIREYYGLHPEESAE